MLLANMSKLRFSSGRVGGRKKKDSPPVPLFPVPPVLLVGRLPLLLTGGHSSEWPGHDVSCLLSFFSDLEIPPLNSSALTVRKLLLLLVLALLLRR